MRIYLYMTLKVSKNQVGGTRPRIGNRGVLGTAVSPEDGKPSVLLTGNDN